MREIDLFRLSKCSKAYRDGNAVRILRGFGVQMLMISEAGVEFFYDDEHNVKNIIKGVDVICQDR